MLNKDSDQNIAKLIKKEITNRILIAISIFILFGSFLSTYDAAVALGTIKNEVTSKIEPLSSFIISQVLVSNPTSIRTALTDFNYKNHPIKAEWISERGKPPKISMKITPTLSWYFNYPIQELNGQSFGYIRVTGSLLNNSHLMSLFLTRFGIIFVFSIFLIFLLIPISKKIPKKLIIEPIDDMLAIIKRKNLGNLEKKTSYPLEIQLLMDDIIKLLENTENETRKTAILKLSM